MQFLLIEKIKIISSLGTKNFSIGFSVIGAVKFIDDLDKLKEFVSDFLENGASFDNVAGMLSEFAGVVGDALIVLGKTETGAALIVVQGIGEIVRAVHDIAESGINWDNAIDAVRGLSNVGFAIGMLTKNKELTGASLAIQGLTTAIEEVKRCWDAIKQGDFSDLNVGTLVISGL